MLIILVFRTLGIGLALRHGTKTNGFRSPAFRMFSVIIPTRDSTGDFDEMCLLAGAESAPLIKSVKTAGQIVAEMAAQAAALVGAG